MDDFNGWFWGFIVFIIMILIGVGMVGCPQYSVYMNGKTGEAELARADYNRKINIREAEATLESSKLLADAEIQRAKGDAAAEVERAKGSAEANKILANSLGGPEGYLRYSYIQMLKDNKNNSVIYIPTEAGLPILEAGKR